MCFFFSFPFPLVITGNHDAPKIAANYISVAIGRLTLPRSPGLRKEHSDARVGRVAAGTKASSSLGEVFHPLPGFLAVPAENVLLPNLAARDPLPMLTLSLRSSGARTRAHHRMK